LSYKTACNLLLTSKSDTAAEFYSHHDLEIDLSVWAILLDEDVQTKHLSYSSYQVQKITNQPVFATRRCSWCPYNEACFFCVQSTANAIPI